MCIVLHRKFPILLYSFKMRKNPAFYHWSRLYGGGVTFSRVDCHNHWCVNERMALSMVSVSLMCWLCTLECSSPWERWQPTRCHGCGLPWVCQAGNSHLLGGIERHSLEPRRWSWILRDNWKIWGWAEADQIVQAEGRGGAWGWEEKHSGDGRSKVGPTGGAEIHRGDRGGSWSWMPGCRAGTPDITGSELRARNHQLLALCSLSFHFIWKMRTRIITSRVVMKMKWVHVFQSTRCLCDSHRKGSAIGGCGWLLREESGLSPSTGWRRDRRPEKGTTPRKPCSGSRRNGHQLCDLGQVS